MNTVMSSYVSGLEVGDFQHFENMGVFPLFSPAEEGIDYITLGTALSGGFIKVTEIDDSGSVPELKVINAAEIPVFLLDGEELAGAKQNRVINTSILLREKSETVIPVSCTEQGRWSYDTEEFYDSGVVMPRNLRAKKSASVADSLGFSECFESDQAEIWDDIHTMSAREDVHSATNAMRDIYKKKMKDLDGYMEAFRPVPHQKGILVLMNGGVAGLDVISSAPSYEELQPKLIKSYAMDAIHSKQKGNGNGGSADEKAKAFLDSAGKCNEKKYKSVGYGWDYRFDGNKMVGSSLAHEDQVIHMSFFRADDSDKAGRISSMSSRRRHRI